MRTERSGIYKGNKPLCVGLLGLVDWPRIVKRYHAAFLLRLLSIGLSFDDIGVLVGARLVVALKASQAASAAGTKRDHAGSIGGHFAVSSAKVPLCFARAIFSGTAQRETYQLKRGESAGSLATA